MSLVLHFLIYQCMYEILDEMLNASVSKCYGIYIGLDPMLGICVCTDWQVCMERVLGIYAHIFMPGAN